MVGRRRAEILPAGSPAWFPLPTDRFGSARLWSWARWQTLATGPRPSEVIGVHRGALGRPALWISDQRPWGRKPSSPNGARLCVRLGKQLSKWLAIWSVDPIRKQLRISGCRLLGSMVAKIHVAPSGIIAGATARLQQVGIVLRSRPSGLRQAIDKSR